MQCHISAKDASKAVACSLKQNARDNIYRYAQSKSAMQPYLSNHNPMLTNGGFQDVGTEEAPVKSANFTQSLLAKKNLRPGFAPKRTARAPTAEDGNEVQPQQRVKKRREERRQPNRRKKQRRNNPSASDEFQLDQAILNRAARHSQWKEWQRGWPKAAPSPGATPVDLCRSFQMKGFCNGNCSFAHKPTDQLRKEDFQAISQKVQLARQLGAA